MPTIDALVLAGGRSSRLSPVDKTTLVYQQQTLVERAVAAVASARMVCVVGNVPTGLLHDAILQTREDPPFGGPAAAIGAGISALDKTCSQSSDHLIVLASDMPHSAFAVTALCEALTPQKAVDGVIAIDAAQRRQPLVALYATAAIRRALDAHRGSLHGMSAFELIGGFQLTEVKVPGGSTDDIDTWADAERYGLEKAKNITKEK